MTKRAPPQHHLEQFIVSVICSLVMVWLSSLAIVYGQIPDQDFQWMLQAAVPPVTSGAAAWVDTNSYLWCYNGTTNTTNALDISGNNNHAYRVTYGNGPITWYATTNAAGLSEGYWHFNGSNAYQCFSNSINGAGDYTLGAWIRVQSKATYTLLYAGTENSEHFVRMNAGDGSGIPEQTLIGQTYETSYNTLALASSTNYTTNVWHYVVFSRSNGVASLWFDCSINKTGALANATAFTRSSFGAGTRAVLGFYAPSIADIYRPYAMGYCQSYNSMTNLYKQTKPNP